MRCLATDSSSFKTTLARVCVCAVRREPRQRQPERGERGTQLGSNHLVLKKVIASTLHPDKTKRSGQQDWTLGFHPAQSAGSAGGFKPSFLNKHGAEMFFSIIFLHAKGSAFPPALAPAGDRRSALASRLGRERTRARADWGRCVKSSLLLNCCLYFAFS